MGYLNIILFQSGYALRPEICRQLITSFHFSLSPSYLIEARSTIGAASMFYSETMQDHPCRF